MKSCIQHITLVVFTTLLAVTGNSCKKEDTKGQIKVVFFENGSVVEGATVRLFIDGDDDEQGFFLCSGGFVTEKLYTTNSSGTINECFELPALVSVEASFTNADGTFGGEGKLNLIEHEETSITVKLTLNSTP